jgi:hypothetical protein
MNGYADSPIERKGSGFLENHKCLPRLEPQNKM